MMERFCKNSERLLTVDYLSQKNFVIDLWRVLNSPLWWVIKPHTAGINLINYLSLVTTVTSNVENQIKVES